VYAAEASEEEKWLQLAEPGVFIMHSHGQMDGWTDITAGLPPLPLEAGRGLIKQIQNAVARTNAASVRAGVSC